MPDIHERHNRDMAFLDRVHVVACLLQPFRDSGTSNPGFVPVVDPRSKPEPPPLNADGRRHLESVVRAIDDAIGAGEGLREYPLDVMNVLVPMRWAVFSLSEAFHWNQYGPHVDHPLPENASEILECLLDQAQRAASRFRDESVRWYERERAQETAA